MMRKGTKILTLLLTLLMVFGATAPAAFAKEGPPPDDPLCESFYLGAVHGINGERLGLDAALPVDVYVNGEYAFTFEFKDLVSTRLPAGEYTISVNLAGTDTEVMSLGPVEIAGCVKVVVKATLVDGVPVLKAKIRDLLPQ